ncbi:MAG: hypothetical protein J5542_11385 [Bacteroidales bacterium]|nr:hypothetical protein [Bacteroidales bacterium]
MQKYNLFAIYEIRLKDFIFRLRRFSLRGFNGYAVSRCAVSMPTAFEWLKPFQVSMASPFEGFSLRRKILRLYNGG